MKQFKVPFAFDINGNVVDVQSAVRGESYKCTCGSEVKIRGGDIISDHFYHLTDSECSLESAIHKAYKSVFLKSKKIRLPYIVNGSDFIEFERVELEKKIDDYIPDAIGYIGDKMYLIEFAKTSYIGERKRNKITKSNLFCLEVDIIKTVESVSDIEDHLTKKQHHKHIIHIPEYVEMQELREKFTVAYGSLKRELSAVKDELRQKDEELTNIKDILNDMRLFYKTECNNGAILFERKLDDYGGKIVAFVQEKYMNIKFHIF
jgi:competence CoiA-like predicted nuclease